jgi:predicted O-methyltransferase YrrM
MDASSTLDSVDNNEAVLEIARHYLGDDSRVRFHYADGAKLLESFGDRQFDLIFADAWPGKFDHLEHALAILRPGGLYIVDDLLPQRSWPDGHAPRIPVFLSALEQHPDLYVTRLCWSTGLAIATKRRR